MTRNLSRELSPSDTDETALIELRLPSKADKVEFAKKINPKSEMVWLSHTQSLRMPYIPQLNDQVYYVPRAHEKYCEDIERRIDYRLRSNEKVPKEIRQLDLMDQLLLCQVESIEVDMLKTSKYRENPIRCLVIMLKVVGGEELQTMAIRYAPLKDCEEFLVFKQLYQDAQKSSLKKESPCSALFENDEDKMEWFDGVIMGEADHSYEHQQSGQVIYGFITSFLAFLH